MTKLMELNPPPKCGEYFTVGQNIKERILIYIDPTSANRAIVPITGMSCGIGYFDNPIRIQKEWVKTHMQEIIEVKKIQRERVKKKLTTCEKEDYLYLKNEISTLSFQIQNLNYFYNRYVCEKYQADICLSTTKTECGQWYKVYHRGACRQELILIDDENPCHARFTYWPEPVETNILFGPVLLTKD